MPQPHTQVHHAQGLTYHKMATATIQASPYRPNGDHSPPPALEGDARAPDKPVQKRSQHRRRLGAWGIKGNEQKDTYGFAWRGADCLGFKLSKVVKLRLPMLLPPMSIAHPIRKRWRSLVSTRPSLKQSGGRAQLLNDVWMASEEIIAA